MVSCFLLSDVLAGLKASGTACIAVEQWIRRGLYTLPCLLRGRRESTSRPWPTYRVRWTWTVTWILNHCMYKYMSMYTAILEITRATISVTAASLSADCPKWNRKCGEPLLHDTTEFFLRTVSSVSLSNNAHFTTCRGHFAFLARVSFHHFTVFVRTALSIRN